MNHDKTEMVLKFTSKYYPNKKQCITSGVLDLARIHYPSVLTTYVLKLMGSAAAKEQVRSRSGSDLSEYLLIHHNNGRTKGRRLVLAVAKTISTNQILFAPVNERYHTAQMDFIILDNSPHN